VGNAVKYWGSRSLNLVYTLNSNIMKNNSTPDYRAKNTDGAPDQLLSYFENHIDKYPDGPKNDEEMHNLNLAPTPDEFYDDDDDTQDESEQDLNPDGSDEDYEEGYRLLESNKDDFTESGYEGL
jgi:hypothetical protein